MKKIFISILTISTILSAKAQNDIDALLVAGVENAERFTNDYLAPGTNGLMHSMNANWFNSGKVKPLFGFEISVVGNAALINDDSKSFTANIADYNNLDQGFTVEFADGAMVKSLATALGENDPDVDIIVTYDGGPLGPQEERITLPSGIGNQSYNLLPSAFVQGAIGLGSGLELKARYVPNIENEDVEVGLYGAGLQFEVTEWLPSGDKLPVSISGLIAYTHLDAVYDLTNSSGVDGENQRIENNTNTLLFQAIASTKLPVINFYGGIGYINGTSESDVLGTYRINNGPIPIISPDDAMVEDPFSVSSEVSALRGTLGTKLKLGFFRLNAEYHFSEFDAFSVGITFGSK